MSTTQPGNLKTASNWFKDLSKSASSVKNFFTKANRQTVKAEDELIEAMVLVLQAHKKAYELVGEKSDSLTVIPPSNRDAHLELWTSWCTELFDEAYLEFTNQADDGNNQDN